MTPLYDLDSGMHRNERRGGTTVRSFVCFRGHTLGQIDRQLRESEPDCLTLGAQYVLVSFMAECDTKIDPRAAWRADVLKELVEAGMDMVRDMRAVAAEPDTPDMSLRFGRVAKAVRMTLALDAKLCDEVSLAAEERVKARRAEHELHLQNRKVEVYNGMARCLERDIMDGFETRKGRDRDAIEDEYEHLDLTDDEYLDQPVSVIIAKICEDLDIAVDWHGLRTEDWALEERKTKPAGSFYANGVPPPFDWDAWFRDHPYPERHYMPDAELNSDAKVGWT